MAQPLQCDFQGCPDQGAVLVQRIGTPDVYVWCDPHYEVVIRSMVDAADQAERDETDAEALRRLQAVSAPELPDADYEAAVAAGYLAEQPAPELPADDEDPEHPRSQAYLAALAEPDPTPAASSDVAEAPAASRGTRSSGPGRRGKATTPAEPVPGPDDPSDEPTDEPARELAGVSD